ncbi:MAG: hypothetical protein A3K77_07565 [Euryarchaeota archaeon RBG_13_31_8]|nr:MAG: hypothetical protein A3K77_07565 [Euryarchaeota archaeon RBG_13_31_8]
MKKIISIVGNSGCGKSTIARRISNIFDYSLIEVSDIVQNINKDGTKLINDTKVWHNLYKAIKKGLNNSDAIVVCGCREAYMLFNIDSIPAYKHISIAILSDKQLRKARLSKRGLNKKEIEQKLNQDEKIGTLEAMWHCKYKVLNEGKLKDAIIYCKNIIYSEVKK